MLYASKQKTPENHRAIAQHTLWLMFAYEHQMPMVCADTILGGDLR